MSDAKQVTDRKAKRWVIYLTLAVTIALVFGVSAMSYLGTFTRLKNMTLSPEAQQAMVRQEKTLGISVPIYASPEAYANPEAYADWLQALHSGDQRRQIQMQRAGRVIELPAGTLVWYQSLTGRGGLTPVRLLGSKYTSRAYWVEDEYLVSRRPAA